MSARDSIPMHRVRPTPADARGRPQSPARKAVEAALRSATRARPLLAVDIASRTGFALDVVRSHISNICSRGWAHNTTPAKAIGRYAWGSDPALAENAGASEVRGAGTYVGRELRPYTGRPGAMDAFALPSLQNGQRVSRKAPIIIAAQGGMRLARGDSVLPDFPRKTRQ